MWPGHWEPEGALFILYSLQDGGINLSMEHYWSHEGRKMDHAPAIKLLPGRAVAAHISLAKARRVAKLAAMGEGKYNLSSGKGP